MVALAKPSGITLRDHVGHVQQQANEILSVWPFLSQKFAQLTNGKNLSASVAKAVKWHDEGKRFDNWQAACRKDYEHYQQWLATKGLDPERVVATEYHRYEHEMRQANKPVGLSLRNAKFRHEFGSLKAAADQKASLSFAERVAVAAHHGKLGKRHVKRWEQDGAGAFIKHWSAFLNQERDEAKHAPDRWEKLLLARYEIAAVRALLQLADTRASRDEAEGKLAPLTKFEYKFPHGNDYRSVQRAALELAEQWCSILRAPTGSGKTDAALLWGQRQIEMGRADRLVIAMPTRFTSNALSLNIEESVGDTGLYHSSAWFTRFGGLSGVEKNNARELQRMAQILATPVTVCTIDHLLISLTGAAEHHHSSFFFLANSAVVFDEADFYDPFVQANLTVLLRALWILKVPVLIMSATVPDSARALYDISDPIKEPPQTEVTPQRALAWAGRKVAVENYPVEGSSTELSVAERAEDVAGVFQKMVRIGHGIVYANTVERALTYFNWFAKNAPETNVILYHSRYTEPDKKFIEEKLLAALGRKAWEDGNPSGVAILTQIGEMSINISASIMLSDLCPWDRLTQRIGRLNRFNKATDAVAYVTVPYRKEQVYVAPYGELVARKWIPAEAFSNTLASALNLISDGNPVKVKPDKLVELVNALYPTLPEFPARAADNRDEFYTLMNQNWLIVPDRRLDEDAGTVSNAWRSRDIDEHRIIFTQSPYNFKNYEEYQAFALENGVACPLWMVDAEKRRKEGSRIDEITVKIDDEETKLFYTTHYESWAEPDKGVLMGGFSHRKNLHRGLAFLYEKDNSLPDDHDD